ncbi:MAG: serine/threonine protein kinase [Deltaproteobacteria bacterium]|nr:serine/threonine protein kinase [Deltaproteobacteria bacterium]MBT4527158.1 serine/threonine protein kinase [Deltaproteobacteria bacterium]
MNITSADFSSLGPDQIIDAVENAIGQRMTGFTSPLPSYINRVYELQTMAGERLIAKFYRPGRWSKSAIEEEHEFMQDCSLAEVPVVLPMILGDGSTLGEVDGIYFAVFPKRLGREFEIIKDEDWQRIGTLIARIHNSGQAKKAPNRVCLHPLQSTKEDVRQLIDGGFLSAQYQTEFKTVSDQIIEIATGLFENTESIRIHGDCHSGNILYRPENGLMIIDFDDMMMGPPIQDLWILLPEHADKCKKELDLMIDGYEMFRPFDWNTVKLIEPLRAMRIIYFLAWCSRQANDLHFKNNFPEWGTESFWSIEINTLTNQLHIIIDSLEEKEEE